MHYAPDVSLDPYYIACEQSTLSEVAIPLIVEDQLIGVFTASHHALDAFPPQQFAACRPLRAHRRRAEQCRRFRAEQQERERMSRESEEAGYPAGAFPEGFALCSWIRNLRAFGLRRRIGGDWYDFIPFDDGRLGLVLADVSGKGLGPRCSCRPRVPCCDRWRKVLQPGGGARS